MFFCRIWLYTFSLLSKEYTQQPYSIDTTRLPSTAQPNSPAPPNLLYPPIATSGFVPSAAGFGTPSCCNTQLQNLPYARLPSTSQLTRTPTSRHAQLYILSPLSLLYTKPTSSIPLFPPCQFPVPLCQVHPTPTFACHPCCQRLSLPVTEQASNDTFPPSWCAIFPNHDNRPFPSHSFLCRFHGSCTNQFPPFGSPLPTWGLFEILSSRHGQS